MPKIKIRNLINDGWIEFDQFDDARTLTAGSYLSGGGDLSANRRFDVEHSALGSLLAGTFYTESEVDSFMALAASRSLTLTAGSFLTGGGDLTADRRFDFAHTTLGTLLAGSFYTETEVDTIIAALAASGVPESRALTAGSYLSGGGDLSANRRFDVNHSLLDGRYYTESEVDTWRASTTQTEMGYVHGVTSDIQDQLDAGGGDADTLDTLDSTQFLRSDADDAITAGITITGTANTSGEVLDLTIAVNAEQAAIKVTNPTHTGVADPQPYRCIEIDHTHTTGNYQTAGLFVTNTCGYGYGAGIWVRNKGVGDAIFIDAGSEAAAGTAVGGFSIGQYKEAWGIAIDQEDADVGKAIQVIHKDTDIGANGIQVYLAPRGVNHASIIIRPYSDSYGSTGSIMIKDSGATKNMIAILRDGKIQWQADTNLYRTAANTLGTDDAFYAGNGVSVRGTRTVDFDTGDYVQYASDQFNFYIGGVCRFYIDSTGGHDV